MTGGFADSGYCLCDNQFSVSSDVGCSFGVVHVSNGYGFRPCGRGRSMISVMIGAACPCDCGVPIVNIVDEGRCGPVGGCGLMITSDVISDETKGKATLRVSSCGRLLLSTRAVFLTAILGYAGGVCADGRGRLMELGSIYCGNKACSVRRKCGNEVACSNILVCGSGKIVVGRNGCGLCAPAGGRCCCDNSRPY